MCSRYEYPLDDALLNHFYQRLPERQQASVQTGTVYPGKKTLVLGLNHKHQVKAGAIRWGFRGYDDSRKHLLINARSETVAEKPTFREAFRYRRIVFPMRQFYEWAPDKTKYIFGANDVLYIAGCYQIEETEYGREAHSVLFTRAANQAVAPIHDRMPVCLPPNVIRRWLSDYEFAAEYLANDHAPELIASKAKRPFETKK